MKLAGVEWEHSWGDPDVLEVKVLADASLVVGMSGSTAGQKTPPPGSLLELSEQGYSRLRRHHARVMAERGHLLRLAGRRQHSPKPAKALGVAAKGRASIEIQAAGWGGTFTFFGQCRGHTCACCVGECACMYECGHRSAVLTHARLHALYTLLYSPACHAPPLNLAVRVVAPLFGAPQVCSLSHASTPPTATSLCATRCTQSSPSWE